MEPSVQPRRSRRALTDPITTGLTISKWEGLKVGFPWQKNIDRHILIDKTALLRSPNANANCNGTDCLIERDFKGYSWIELAQPLAVDFIPSKTNMLKPEERAPPKPSV